MISKQSYLYWPTLLTVITLFVFALVANKLVNLCFYILILISMSTFLVQRDALSSFVAMLKQYWPLNLAMFGMVFAVFINQLASSSFTSHIYDLPSRLAFFAMIFWIFLRIPYRLLVKIKWSFIAGTIFYTYIIYRETQGGSIRANTINTFSIIFFCELVFLMSIFSVLSIGWETKINWANKSIHLLAGLSGLYSIYLAQTRGAWVAIPMFVLLIGATFINRRWTRKKLLMTASIFIVILAVFSSTNIVRERIEQATQDLSQFTEQKNSDTSLGTRLQLWNASWIIFSDHPLVGIGKENFSASLKTLAERGIITVEAARYDHSHNEILYNMATLGIFGLLGILLTYLAPAYYFVKEMRHADARIKSSAAMGLCLIAGYFIFGLFDVLFYWKICDVFFCIAAALFLAVIEQRKKELPLP